MATNPNQVERQWAYELWVHLSDHVNQRCEPGQPSVCPTEVWEG
jgi:hypothetical protein